MWTKINQIFNITKKNKIIFYYNDSVFFFDIIIDLPVLINYLFNELKI